MDYTPKVRVSLIMSKFSHNNNIIQAMVPSECIGLIIGPLGTTLEAICEYAGGNCRITRNERYSHPNIFTIVSDRHSCSQAARLKIHELVDNSAHRNRQIKWLKIDPNIMPLLVGEGGRNIRALRSFAGYGCTISEDLNPSWLKVSAWHQEALEIVEKELQELHRIAEFSNQNRVVQPGRGQTSHSLRREWLARPWRVQGFSKRTGEEIKVDRVKQFYGYPCPLPDSNRYGDCTVQTGGVVRALEQMPPATKIVRREGTLKSTPRDLAKASLIRRGLYRGPK